MWDKIGKTFNNVGGKMKTVAKIYVLVDIILSILFGAAWMLIGLASIFSGEGIGFILILLGIIVIPLYGLLGWMVALPLYGQGQMIENTDKMAGRNDKSSFEDQNRNIEKELPRL